MLSLEVGRCGSFSSLEISEKEEKKTLLNILMAIERCWGLSAPNMTMNKCLWECFPTLESVAGFYVDCTGWIERL